MFDTGKQAPEGIINQLIEEDSKESSAVKSTTNDRQSDGGGAFNDVISKHPISLLIKAVSRRVDQMEVQKNSTDRTLSEHENNIKNMSTNITKMDQIQFNQLHEMKMEVDMAQARLNKLESLF